MSVQGRSIFLAQNWWQRSANSASQFRNVNTNGNSNNNNATNTNNCFRPDLTKLHEAVKGERLLKKDINVLTR